MATPETGKDHRSMVSREAAGIETMLNIEEILDPSINGGQYEMLHDLIVSGLGRMLSISAYRGMVLDKTFTPVGLASMRESAIGDINEIVNKMTKFLQTIQHPTEGGQ